MISAGGAPCSCICGREISTLPRVTGRGDGGCNLYLAHESDDLFCHFGIVIPELGVFEHGNDFGSALVLRLVSR